MNYFNSLLATVGVGAACSVLWFLWMKLEPKYNHKPIEQSSSFLTVFFWVVYPVCMLFIAANIIVSTTWRVPDSLENILHNLFMTRVSDLETTAHSVSYLTIPVFFYYTLWRTRDSWKSALASAFIVYLHEGIWFLFYYAKYWSVIDWSAEILPDLNFLFLVCTFGQIYLRKYGLNRKVLLIVLSQVFYDTCWFIVGFPITCTNNNAAMIRFGVTEYIDNIFVNSIEVGGWLLLLYFSILWVYLNTRKSEIESGSFLK